MTQHIKIKEYLGKIIRKHLKLQTNTLNHDGAEIVSGGRRYRVGDIGFIINIDTENQLVNVSIDGNIIDYEYSELDELVLAYAVSIHKSQGSEYPAVIIPLTMAHYVMLQRNLLYTGVTRGKKLVVVIGSKKAVHLCIKNNKVTERNTGWNKESVIFLLGNIDNNVLDSV